MKRLISLILAALMMFSLAACGEKESQKDPVKDPIDDSIDNVVDDTPNMDEDTTTNNEDNQENIEEDDSIVVGSLNERLAYIINDAREDKEEVEVFPASISNINGVLDVLLLSEDQVDEYSVAMSMMSVHAYTIAIMKASLGQDEILVQALNEYKDRTIKSFEQYLPNQLEIAQNAIVFADKGYVGIVMCDNQDKVEKSITDWLSRIDEIEIDESLAIIEYRPMALSDIMYLNELFLDGAVTEVGWAYFDEFEKEEVDLKPYIIKISVGDGYSVIVGGESLETNPEYIHFVDESNSDNYVDIMTESIEEILE